TFITTDLESLREVIYVMDIDGSNLVQLTNGDYSNLDHAFSPDGSRIVFSSRRGDLPSVEFTELTGERNIYLMDSDGSNQTQLTDNTMASWNPAWSPDGLRIVFDANNTGRYTGWAIYVIDIDGTNLQRLTSISKSNIEPVWSPDGSRILYFFLEVGNIGFYTMNPDGSNKVRLTINNEDGIYAAWSPDGTKIAFRSRREAENWDIYIMDSDGSNQVNLTRTIDFNERWPSWVYGSKIAYSASSDNVRSQIHLMDLKGSNVIKLTNMERGATHPSLSLVSIIK
ncbi:PD40 domain-containing protein, partial [candidate division KSB1 bacterium]|nr:PD40 domain-containing protein [candidate division KSB1 bacterium]